MAQTRDRWKRGVIKLSGRKVRPSTNYPVVVLSYDTVHSLGIDFNWHCTGETTDLRPWYTAFMYISSHELDNKTAHEPAIHKCLATVNSGLTSLLSCQPAVLQIIQSAWKVRRKATETWQAYGTTHDNSTKLRRCIQWRTERGFGGVQTPTPPKFRSFDKAAFNCKLSGKCLVFLFQHPN